MSRSDHRPEHPERGERAERSGRPPSTSRRGGDTLAWLCAAFQVIGPVLLVLILVILLAYGLIHLLFLR